MVARRKRQVATSRKRDDRRRVAAKQEVEKPTDEEAIKERLKVIAKGIDSRRVDIELRQNEIAEYEEEAQKLLDELGIDEFNVPRVGTHLFKEKFGRASSTIDVVAFHEHVTEDEFWGSVSVTKKAAEQVLSNINDHRNPHQHRFNCS